MKFRIIFIFIHFVFLGSSQELPPNSPVATIDSVIVSNAQLSADSLLEKIPETNNIIFPKKFKSRFQSKYTGEDFNYTTVKPQESLWQKIKKRIGQWLQSILGNVNPQKSAGYAEIILRIAAIIIVGFVIYFLIKFFLGKNGNFLFNKKNKKLNIEDHDLYDNIHEINFPESIAKFERQNDYRSAIRYQFLLVLKKLTDQKVIIWNPEKTNKDYLADLKKPKVHSDFKDLIYIFDYVWYGEFIITEEKYIQLKQKFSNFKI